MRLLYFCGHECVLEYQGQGNRKFANGFKPSGLGTKAPAFRRGDIYITSFGVPMPVVLRANGFKFFFYQADVANEPPHVHVGKEGNEAKFWLDPVRVAREGRFRKSDLRDIEHIIEDNLEFLLSVWEKEKSKHVNS
jgi:hypothetical protein